MFSAHLLFLFLSFFLGFLQLLVFLVRFYLTFHEVGALMLRPQCSSVVAPRCCSLFN